MLDERQIAQATRCLWSLQEAAMEIEGLLLTEVDGLTWTTTLHGDDRTERLAAVATAMFLLGEEASETWGQGESSEMFIKLGERHGDPDDVSYVIMRAVGYRAVLVAVCHAPHVPENVQLYLTQAVQYLLALLDGDNPSPPIWGTETET